MNAVAFDTLRTARALEGKGFSRALEGKGFSREQSEGLAEQLAEGRTVDLSHLATREELRDEIAKLATKEELKHEVAKLATKDELKHEVAKLATKDELKHEIALVRADLKSEVALVRADMRDLENRMTIKLGGMLVVITGVLLAAIRYLPAAH